MTLDQAVAWYADLYAVPGWQEYVRHRVRELAKEWPEFFGDLPDRMTTEVRRRRLADADANRN
jgi:hypothetical protein